MKRSALYCFFVLLFCVGSILHASTSHGLVSAGGFAVHAKSKAPLIILDPGHGGSDEGAKVRNLQEKRITLLTALYAKKYLETLGYRVLLTRSRDCYVSLPKRVAMANKTQGELFVSIHFNSAKNTLAEGVEVFFYKDKGERMSASQKLAQQVLSGVLGETLAVSRGVKTGNFHVIRETQMPAIIVEAGFMTNNEEWMNLKKKLYLEKIARGIAWGADRYLQKG